MAFPRPGPNLKFTSSTMERGPARHTSPAARRSIVAVAIPMPVRIAAPPFALSTTGTASPSPVKFAASSVTVISVVAGLKPISTLSSRSRIVFVTR